MPIYEYVCTDCGHEFDALQKMSDGPLCECPVCKQNTLRKKISAPRFRLGGSGWYETDFKSENQKNLAKPDSSDRAATKSAEGKKEPAKPAKDSAAGKEAAA